MATAFSSGSQSPTSLSRTIDRVFEDAQHTGEINLSGRKLKEYPKSVSAKYDLVDTIGADLSKNRLQDVPKEVCDFGSMEKLNCYHNVLKFLPDALVQLQALTHLNISRNQLSMIPTFISQLHQLEVLIASHNKLVSLPEEIGVLDKLMEIDVSCNEISHLPSQIGDLKSLRSLNVRRNLLIELPIEISKLNLRKLDFSSNKISKIPTLFRKIETLEEIVLDNNPLTQPPAHVCTKGKQHIMKFLQIEAIREERKRGVMNDAEMKRLRKSLPPQQSLSSEEFRNMLESPESKAWKRHTVLSSDSGYSTTDSIEKCGWSTTEQTNGDISHMDEASHLSLKTAEMVREQRHVRDLDYRHRLLPHELKHHPPPPITLVPQSDLPPKSPALTPKTPTPQHNQHPMYSQAPPPRSPEGYQSSSPQLTPDTPVAVQAQGFDDQISRELQRQKSDYERRKKMAEQLRMQQEQEDEKEQRRRAAIRLQEEQRALLDRQRGEMRAQEDARLEAQRQEEVRKREEARLQEEAQRQEEARLREDQRQKDEARKMEEQKQHEDSQKYKVENNYGYLHNTWHAPDPPTGYSGYSSTGYSPTGYSPTGYSYGNRYDSSPTDTYSMQYGKPGPTSQSFKEERKTTSSNTHYRRTASDSTPKHPQSSIPHNPSRSNHVKNGPSNPRNPSGSSSTSLVSPSPSPRSSIGSAGPSPASSTSSVNKAGESKQIPSSVARRGKISERVAASTNPTKGPAGVERHGRATTASTTGTVGRQPAMSKTLPTTASTNSARKNHVTPEEEFRQKHQSLKTSQHQEAQRAKSRLDDPNKLRQTQREAVNNFVSKRQSSTSSDEDKKKILAPRTSYSSVSAKRQGAVLSNSTMKVIDSYKDSDPNFTIRRQMDQQREEVETMESLRRTIETKLKVTLPENIQDVLRDGVLLCQLANSIRPRSVTSIHVPSPAVPKLTLAKCRKNVENFLEACRKIGVNRDQICAAQDILEEKGISRVAVTISALVAIATNPRSSNV
ncbi:leucine-rich repeat and calponin homology domain-containing protein 3-like isoform X1 [Mizuhopecten yessoensis]|uniref:leucine-rich repeat and calponin homology domain-containing protein 3-like isoform X1 n=1 Tax=Mizuhopecten yessoensis TaxID=6573 RepID=UPI000B45E8CF|nr:leucine-rich repeat and calponin homology domain-containing protein 3-like isoform X1 [Mizuhopecten yessoensis]